MEAKAEVKTGLEAATWRNDTPLLLSSLRYIFFYVIPAPADPTPLTSSCTCSHLYIPSLSTHIHTIKK